MATRYTPPPPPASQREPLKPPASARVTSEAPIPRTSFGATMRELEQSLRYDPRNLSVAFEQQPELFYQVAKRLAIVISERDTAKLELDDIKAACTAEAYDTEEKMTVDKVKNYVRLQPAVSKATKFLQTLEREVGELSALKEAFIQRGYSLRSEGELQTRTGSAAEIADIKATAAEQRRYYPQRGGR